MYRRTDDHGREDTGTQRPAGVRGYNHAGKNSELFFRIFGEWRKCPGMDEFPVSRKDVIEQVHKGGLT